MFNILVVSTHECLCEQAAKALSQIANAHITCRDDGLGALQLLRENVYDLVVSDIDLGNLDVWRLTRLIRSGMLKSSADTRVVVLSSTHSDRIAEATAKEFEVDRFIAAKAVDTLPTIAKNLLHDSDRAVAKTSILVVEDYQDTADLIHRILHKRYDVTIAKDGKAGLDAWREHKHDIVLLDLMLPKMTGEEVLKAILHDRPEQSVVMMTAHGDSEKAAGLILAGAVDFIAKPFKADRLRHVCEIAAHREDFVVSNAQFNAKQSALVKEKHRAQITLQSIIDGVITTDHNGVIDYINPIAKDILKISSEDALGQDIEKVYRTYHDVSHIPAANLAKKAISQNNQQRSAQRNILKDSENNERIITQQASPIRNEFGQAVGSVVVFNDQTEVSSFEQQLSYHTKHDYLTGLANRASYDPELRLAIHESKTSSVEHCICLLSLSQFNIVNETSGHIVGDKLLQHVSQVLMDTVKAPSDLVARTGGDEFSILLRHCSADTAQSICKSILEKLDECPFEFEGASHNVNLGIGILSLNGNIDNLGDAISAVSAACTLAKSRGKNRVACYNGEDIELLEKRQEVFLAKDLARAIEQGRIRLYQQKIAAVNPSERDSYEILCRVIDEDGNVLAPAPYLTAAERYHLTPELDRWVVKHTLDWIVENEHFADRCEYISINLSGLSICDDTFAGYVKDCFDQTGIAPEKICFEITETSAVSNFVKAQDFITALRDLGCKFSLDDFGSGMSSFAYLKKLSVDILKIDGMFVKDILNDPIDLAMVKSINEIGQVIGLKTVAEYVENEEIAQVLKEIGVDCFQGYHIAKPMPLDELSEPPQQLDKAN